MSLDAQRRQAATTANVSGAVARQHREQLVSRFGVELALRNAGRRHVVVKPATRTTDGAQIEALWRG